MRVLISTSTLTFFLAAGCGDAGSTSTGGDAGESSSGEGSSATSLTSDTDTGFTDSTTSASGGTTDDTATSAGTSAGEGETGAFDETGDEGEDMGTPGTQESVFELYGTLGRANELDGEGAFVFVEYDEMGFAVERCLIEFVVTHVSNPSDCMDCFAAFESAFGQVEVLVDEDGGCLASGFDQTIFDAPMRWGVDTDEFLHVHDGTAWTLIENAEAWSEPTQMEAGLARWDLGVNTGP